MQRPSDTEINLNLVRNYGNSSPLTYIGSFSQTCFGLKQVDTFFLCLKRPPARGGRGSMVSVLPVLLDLFHGGLLGQPKAPDERLGNCCRVPDEILEFDHEGGNAFFHTFFHALFHATLHTSFPYTLAQITHFGHLRFKRP